MISQIVLSPTLLQAQPTLRSLHKKTSKIHFINCKQGQFKSILVRQLNITKSRDRRQDDVQASFCAVSHFFPIIFRLNNNKKTYSINYSCNKDGMVKKNFQCIQHAAACSSLYRKWRIQSGEVQIEHFSITTLLFKQIPIYFSILLGHKKTVPN